MKVSAYLSKHSEYIKILRKNYENTIVRKTVYLKGSINIVGMRNLKKRFSFFTILLFSVLFVLK